MEAGNWRFSDAVVGTPDVHRSTYAGPLPGGPGAARQRHARVMTMSVLAQTAAAQLPTGPGRGEQGALIEEFARENLAEAG